MFVQIRQDLINDGIEFIQACDTNNFYSAKQIAESKYLGCDDCGIVSIELPNGEITSVDSMDLEYINE